LSAVIFKKQPKPVGIQALPGFKYEQTPPLRGGVCHIWRSTHPPQRLLPSKVIQDFFVMKQQNPK
jgi:hypothetical protein